MHSRSEIRRLATQDPAKLIAEIERLNTRVNELERVAEAAASIFPNDYRPTSEVAGRLTDALRAAGYLKENP